VDWLSLVPSALSAVSSLFGKKPPQYQQPQQPNLQQISGQLNQAAPIYDPTGSQFGQGLMQQQDRGLPPAYRQAMLDQARNEARTSFSQVAEQLNMERERATRGSAEQANRLGLLGSGGLGVRQGMIDQSYGQQLGNLAQNAQNQLAGVGTNLMQQEFDQRGRIQQLLASLEGQKSTNSVAARQGLGTLYNTRAQLGQTNAQNQYQSELNEFDIGQANFGQGLKSLGALAGQYRLFNPYQTPQVPTPISVRNLVNNVGGESLYSAYRRGY
jgi:hypothetical protein